jgi:hypothetical protein
LNIRDIDEAEIESNYKFASIDEAKMFLAKALARVYYAVKRKKNSDIESRMKHLMRLLK